MKFRGSRDPVLYLSDPAGVERAMKRDMLDDLAKLNTQKLHDFGDPEIATRIAQYEMSFRMQSSVPELADFSNEPASVLESYGPDVREAGTFALQLPHGAPPYRAGLPLCAAHACRMGSA